MSLDSDELRSEILDIFAEAQEYGARYAFNPERDKLATDTWLSTQLAYRTQYWDDKRLRLPPYVIEPHPPLRTVDCKNCKKKIEFRPGCRHPTYHRCSQPSHPARPAVAPLRLPHHCSPQPSPLVLPYTSVSPITIDAVCMPKRSYHRIKETLLAFVFEQPGCTSRDVRCALGASAAARLSTLAARGTLRRELVNELWRYYTKERKE